jgi:hypothetical protein
MIPTYVSREHERRQQERKRAAMAAPWYPIPAGFYAVPVTDSEEPYLLGTNCFNARCRARSRTARRSAATAGNPAWR